MESHTARAEADRWIGISAKLLNSRDLVGSKTFAIRAKESDPSNPIIDQILAVVDTLMASEKRVINSTNYDWYSILQISHLVREYDLIASQYGRLVMLLNPEHNGLPYADLALRLVVDAWSVLSDPQKKWMYDSELTLFLQRNSTPTTSAAFEHPPESVRVDSDSTFQFFQQPVQPPQHQPEQWLYQHQPQQPQLQELLQQHHNQHPPPQEQPQPPQGPPQAHPQRQTRAREQQMKQPPPVQQPAVSAQKTHQPPVSSQLTQQPPLQGGRGGGKEVNERTRNVDEGGSTNNVGKYDGNSNASGNDGVGDVDEDDGDNDEEIETFWTTCPYCYYTYQYPKIFQDYTLRCQNCRRAFHAAQIPNPPPFTRGGKETTFCCWGYFPLGFSMTTSKKNNPVRVNVERKPVVYLDDDGEDLDVPYTSDDSDSSYDWNSTRKSKKRKTVKSSGKGRVGRKSNAEKERERIMNQNLGVVDAADSKNPPGMTEIMGNDVPNKAGASGSSRKQTGKGVRGRKKLDLNVEFSNEVEEQAPSVNTKNGEEEVGFFEGLDEFLSTLPILHVVGDDKAKPS